MPLATDINSGNVFQFIKLEESMVGEDSKQEETCSELVRTHFTIKKLNSDENFRKFKRSGIGLIAEFREIPNRFPNQASLSTPPCQIVTIS
jgi:hypothetical protein